MRETGIAWLPEVGDEWETYKVAHGFSDIGSGTTPDTENPNFYDGDVPWVTTGELRESLVTETSKKVTRLAVREHSALRIFPPGTLLIAMYGATIGRLGVLGVSACLNQACCALRAGTFLETRFVYYWLLGFREHVIQLASGGGQPNISQEKIRSLRVPAPARDVQLRIASFLDRKTAAIDALIAKKERLIGLLQEKRQALITQAVTKGLDGGVEMKDSGVAWFGTIPAHWEIHQLRRVVSRFIDYRGRTPTKVETGVPLITAGAVRGGRIDHSRAPEYVTREECTELMRRGLPELGDVVFTSEAPLGEVAQVTDVGVAFAQRIILFKVNRARMTGEFLWLFYCSGPGISEVGSRASGSTAEGIRADRLRGSLVPVPPLDEQRLIVEEVRSRLEHLEPIGAALEMQIEKLREYRQALITAAVTGKIDVSSEAA